MKKKLSNKGFTALLSILIIISVSLIIGLSVSMSGINQVQDTLSQNFSSEAFAFADSCVEEGILRLKRDSGYTGGTLTMNSITCNVQITDIGGDSYKIETEASSENTFFRKVTAEVSILTNGQARNIIINSWTENGS